MKKTFILTLFIGAAVLVCAQQIRYIYVPGDSEHQTGLLFGSSLGGQNMLVDAYGSSQFIHNVATVDCGMFWGYETDHGTFLDFGNHVSLLYSLLQFNGTVEGFRSGGDEATAIPFSHQVGFRAQSLRFYENPFLTYRLNTQTIFNVGVGFGLNIGLPGRPVVDGIVMEKEEYNFFTRLFFDLDAMLGVKYFFTDDLFVSFQAHYAFYTFDIRNLFESNIDPHTVGGIGLSDDGSVSSVSLPSSKPFRLLVAFGHLW